MKRPKVVCETPLYKAMLVYDSSVLTANRQINAPAYAVKIVMDYLGGADQKHFQGLYMNTSNNLMTIHTVSIGILNSSLVHRRAAF